MKPGIRANIVIKSSVIASGGCCEFLRRNLPARRVPLHAERLHRTLDVLQRQCAEIIELHLDPLAHEVTHRSRDHDAAWRRLGLQPRRHVHAIAIEILAIDDQVAQVQADAEDDGCVHGLVPVGLGHCLLELDGGA